ncbi:hypothetical protein L195_g035254, partial [Trifolium pratense]
MCLLDYTGEDVELCPPSSSKKRKNSQKDVNDELQKPVKRRKYRPKVVSQVPKRTKKSQPKSNNTPKPATPKQCKTYVRRKTPKPKVVSQVPKRTKQSQAESNNTPRPATPKQLKTYVRRKTPKCQRPLFVDGDNNSLPFLENFNHSKVEQDEIETSLSCLTLVKRKKVRSQIIQLVKLLTPSAKGKRSTNFIRKRRCWTDLCDGMSRTSRKMESLIKRIVSLKKQKHLKPNKLVARKKSGELVLYKKKIRVDVILDEETLRVSNLLLAERGHHEPNQSDEQKQYWKETRDFYQKRFNMFLHRMCLIQ